MAAEHTPWITQQHVAMTKNTGAFRPLWREARRLLPGASEATIQRVVALAAYTCNFCLNRDNSPHDDDA